MFRWLCSVAFLGLVLSACPSSILSAPPVADGYVPLFNGKDFTGWVNVNCDPGTFFYKEGMLVTTGKPTGFLRTTKMYENFVAEFEWKHINVKEVGNSGFFIWGNPLTAPGTPFTKGIEVQVLVNLEKEGFYTSHGDIFSIHGATCKPDRPHPNGAARCLPSERRCKGGGEWNHYKVTANNGIIKLEVNGKEVSGVSECNPRKGYLAFESEGAECHFRNAKIRELPSTNPKPNEVAEEAQEFRNLYSGIDLKNWVATEQTKKSWQPKDWVLHTEGTGSELATEKELGACELQLDVKFPAKDAKPLTLVLRKAGDTEVALQVQANGKFELSAPSAKGTGELKLKPVGQWTRLLIKQQGDEFTLNTNVAANNTKLTFAKVPTSGKLILRPAGPMDFANIVVRDLK